MIKSFHSGEFELDNNENFTFEFLYMTERDKYLEVVHTTEQQQ